MAITDTFIVCCDISNNIYRSYSICMKPLYRVTKTMDKEEGMRDSSLKNTFKGISL